jgi:hypothetical protein
MRNIKTSRRKWLSFHPNPGKRQKAQSFNRSAGFWSRPAATGHHEPVCIETRFDLLRRRLQSPPNTCAIIVIHNSSPPDGGCLPLLHVLLRQFYNLGRICQAMHPGGLNPNPANPIPVRHGSFGRFPRHPAPSSANKFGRPGSEIAQTPE